MTPKLHNMVCPKCRTSFNLVPGNVGECLYCKTHSITHPHFVDIEMEGEVVQLEFCSTSCADAAFGTHIPMDIDVSTASYQRIGDPLSLTEAVFHRLLDASKQK